MAGSNTVTSGGCCPPTSPQPKSQCGCQQNCMCEIVCDPIKDVKIVMGMLSGTTCEGNSFMQSIDVINPKTNANQNINEVLFQLCAQIEPNQTIGSADPCIDVAVVGTSINISLNAEALVTKLCDDPELVTALQTCLGDNDTTVTSLIYDPVDGKLTLTSSDGAVLVAEIPTFIETISPLVLGANGTFTYTDEAGSSTTYVPNPDVVTTIVDNGDNSFTYTNEDGIPTTITFTDMAETNTTLVDNGDNSFTYTSEDGTVTTFTVPAAAAETITALVDNGDGTFTYINEDGVAVTVNYCDCPRTQVTSADGSVTVVNTGTPEAPVFDLSATFTVDVNVDMFTYDPATKVITLTETDGTVHTINVSDLVDAETVTTMVIQVDGSTIYTNEDGVTTTIAASVEVKSNDNTINVVSTGTATAPCYDLSVVIPEEIRIDDYSFDSNTNILTIEETDGTAFDVDLSALVSAPETVTNLIDNGDGSFTYVNEDGIATTINYMTDVCAEIAGFGDVGPLTPEYKIVAHHTVDGACALADLPVIPDSELCENVLNALNADPTKVVDWQTALSIEPDTNGVLSGFVDNGDGTATATFTPQNGEPATTATITFPQDMTIPDTNVSAVIGSTVDNNGNATVTITEDGVSLTGTIACVQPLRTDCDGNPKLKGGADVTLDDYEASRPTLCLVYVDSGDEACTPVPPAGKWAAYPHISQNPDNGDIWKWDNGAFVEANISADTGLSNLPVSAGLVSQTFLDADLGGVAGGLTQVGEVEETITNNDCVPWIIHAHVRVFAQVALSPDNQYRVAMAVSAGNTFPWQSVPDEIFDTIGSTNPQWDSKEELQTYGYTILLPGASVTIGMQSQISRNAPYSPDAQNRVQVLGLRGTLMATRASRDSVAI